MGRQVANATSNDPFAELPLLKKHDGWTDRESTKMFMRILLRYDLDGNAPNEVAQETILALRKTLPHIGGRALLRNFEARICTSECVDGDNGSLSFSRPYKSSDAMTAAPGSGEIVPLARTDDPVKNLMQQLPVSFRAPVALAVAGFSSERISNLLGEPISTIRQILSSTNAQLLVNPKPGASETLQ